MRNQSNKTLRSFQTSNNTPVSSKSFDGDFSGSSEDKQYNIALYIRLSREDGNEESESVINQKKILLEYLEKSFESQYAIVDFFVDDGLTGTDDTRADFMRMIHAVETGKVNCIICKTLARAFRNYSDQGYYLEYFFPQKNIRFISTGDPHIDTYKNPEAITGLEVPITGLMNDRFAGRTSNDVRRTFNTKRRNGEFIGAFAPYGYLKDASNKNRLILDPDIYPIKRDMRNWIVNEGMSLNGVARRLNDMGIPNPTSYKKKIGLNYNNPHAVNNDGLWTGSTIRRILLDKVNLGHMVQGKQRVVSYKVHDRISVPEEQWFVVHNTHEATFTQEEYDQLAGLLIRDTRTPNGSRTVHLFSGFLKCADCHKALHRRESKSYVYYACRTYGEKSKKRCTKHSIRVDLLEAAVLAGIQAQILLVEQLSEAIEKISSVPVVNTQSSRVEALLKSRRLELERVRNASDSLYVDWKSGDISAEDYRRMKQKFDRQIKNIIQIIGSLEDERLIINSGVETDNPLLTSFLERQNIMALDRGVLVSLVDTVFIHENKEITIRFKFDDQLRRILEHIGVEHKMGC